MMKDTLDRGDIELADYVMRYSQWHGDEPPGPTEVPSGRVKQALDYAEIVKALKRAKEEEDAELEAASDAALMDELFPKNLERGEKST